MTRRRKDEPFPGARSQVTARPFDTDAASGPPVAGGLRQLPLEASPVRQRGGWVIRLPVRAEHVAVDKDSVVYERVVVRRVHTDAMNRVDGSVRREELRVEMERN